MAQTRLKSGNLHMVGGDNGSDGNVLKSKGDGTMEWGTIIINPTFSSFDYPGDDTALDPAGGQSLVINGTGFNSSVTVTIGGTTCSSITRNSSEQLTVTTPAKSAGSQAVVITNTDGGSASTNVSYNGIPAFTNAAGSLGSAKAGESINLSAVATEPDGGAITYAITSGALPSGVALNTSTGAITGTAPSVSANTTSNFTVTATDNENQSTARAYSITVTPPLPSEHFGIVTYTGNASTRSFTGLGFKPDLVLTKSRSYAEKINVFDSTRGVTKRLYLTDTHSEAAQTNSLTSFDNDGWTIGDWGDVNQNSQTYVSWCFKANGGTTSSNTDGTITSTVQTNSALGFSIVKWTGTGAQGQIGHGLSSAPDMIISKRLNATNNWTVYHKDLGLSHSTYPNWLYLNHNSSEQDSSSSANHPYYQDPSSTLIYQNTGTSETSNVSGGEYISYCFKSVDGFSKIGSYVGNGNANGPIIETGFEPAFIMVKRYNAVSNWVIYDNKRNTTNPRYSYLMANETSAETGSAGSAAPQLDFFSNGFRPSGTEGYVNANQDKYIYIAFAADPDTTAPTLADSFSTVTYTGNGAQRNIDTGFKPGMVWWKSRDTGDHNIGDIIRGKNFIRPNSTIAQYAATDQILSYNDTSYTIGTGNDGNQSGRNFCAWVWKADDNESTIFGGSAKAVYKFEDNGNDVTGDYNGTASNVTYSSSGKFNKAAEFNGSSSKITSTAGLSGNPVFSISFWIYPTSTGTPIMFGNNISGQAFLTFINSSYKLNFGRWGDSLGDSTASVPQNTWTHIVIVNNSGSVQLYINGVADLSFSTTYSIANTNFYIGAANSGQYFDGKIDQVRIYNGAINDIGVAALYAETASDNDDLTLGAPPKSIVSANANSGFSIVKWTGDGIQGSKVPHGLSAAPELIMMKDLSATNHWVVGNSESGWTKAMHLDLTNADNASDLYWDDTAPTATVFTLGHHSTAYNVSGNEYIAYCFHSVSGYSKIGSYSGTGSSNAITGLGFQPDYVMIKEATAAESWRVFDSVRGATERLFPDLDNAESTANDSLTSFDSNGFTLGSSAGVNQSSQTYIYAAFKIN